MVVVLHVKHFALAELLFEVCPIKVVHAEHAGYGLPCPATRGMSAGCMFALQSHDRLSIYSH